MKVLGIIAEYDPFHNGHLYHISEAKRLCAPDFTFVALSPCLKQRGVLSLLSPSDRAKCALHAGADAVFALPVLWTVRDAEHYALGAVSLLSSLGVTHLAFGAETGHLPILESTASLLESPPAALKETLKSKLSGGIGYPAALASAASAVLPESGTLLEKPNNTLAVCYLRAIHRLELSITPVPVPRTGDYHDARIDPAAPSASSLRNALLRGSWADACCAVPAFSALILRRRFLEGRIPDERILDALLLSRLREMRAEDYALLPGLSEGMENLLRSAAASSSSRKQLIAALTGRRYPSARASRLCAHALLGVAQADLDTLPLPDHALLLGLRKRTDMTAHWKNLSFPVLASFAEWKKAAHPADLAAWRLWAQCCRLPDTLPFTEKMVTVD